MARKRIFKEWTDIQKEDLGEMNLAPKDDDMFTWEARLVSSSTWTPSKLTLTSLQPGPEGSVYEGGAS